MASSKNCLLFRRAVQLCQLSPAACRASSSVLRCKDDAHKQKMLTARRPRRCNLPLRVLLVPAYCLACHTLLVLRAVRRNIYAALPGAIQLQVLAKVKRVMI